MHDTGFLTVKDNKLCFCDSSIAIEHPAIILDTSSGTLLKVGDIKWVKDYYEKACGRLRIVNKDIADSLALLEFEYLNSNLSIDELCTMINYFNNSVGPDSFKKFFLLTEEETHQKLRSLMEAGF